MRRVTDTRRDERMNELGVEGYHIDPHLGALLEKIRPSAPSASAIHEISTKQLRFLYLVDRPHCSPAFDRAVLEDTFRSVRIIPYVGGPELS